MKRPELDKGYIDSWQLRDKKDVHPSHRQKVVTVQSIMDYIDHQRDKGNMYPDRGFSAALCLSGLIKELDR